MYPYELMLSSSLTAWFLIYRTNHITQAAHLLLHSSGLLSQLARSTFLLGLADIKLRSSGLLAIVGKPAAILTQLNVFSFVLIKLKDLFFVLSGEPQTLSSKGANDDVHAPHNRFSE